MAGLLVVMLAPQRGHGDSHDRADQADHKAIAKWISQLGDRNFAVREKASDNLWRAGSAAVSLLRQAARSDNAEVAARARYLLDRIRYDVPPDTPLDLAKLVGEYRSGDVNQQREALQELYQRGPRGYVMLARLATAERDPERRRQMFDPLAHRACEDAERAVANGQNESASALLDLAVPSMYPQALYDYAAYHLLNGTIDERIARYRDLSEQNDDPRDPEILVHLLRAKGDLDGARRIAEKAKLSELLETVLAEMGDWKALAAAVREGDASNPREAPSRSRPLPGYMAACYRLAGNARDFEAELRSAAAAVGPEASRALLLNDRPTEGLAAFLHGREYADAFELHAARMEFREALKVADEAAGAPAEEVCLLHILKAKLFLQLGENDKAVAEADKAVAMPIALAPGKEDREPPAMKQLRSLVGVEYRLGLKQQALAHAGRLLPKSRRDASEVLEQIWPTSKTAARVWWLYFMDKDPREETVARLKRIQALLDARSEPKEFAQLAHALEEATRTKSDRAEQALMGLAETCLVLGKNDRSRDYLVKAANLPIHGAAPLLRLGDFYAEQKRWREVAEAYGQAWEKLPTQPLALHLRGWALQHLGKEKEGAELIQRAHWLPLGRADARLEYADALAERGLAEAAGQERLFVGRTAAYEASELAKMQSGLQDDAIARKDFLQAAEDGQRILLLVLRFGAGFVRAQGFLNVPAAVHRYRARGLLAAGKIDEARREIELSLRYLPGDIDWAILMTGELEQHGLRGDADRLFDRVFEVNAAACVVYPRSATLHNSLAWLAARCHRKLEVAREHARKAVELKPDNAGLLDTLAEVDFQSGRKEAAIAMMKRCIQLEPRREYYRKQLQRFEAGDPKAEVPES
jgi:hypothetical protein